MPYLTLRNATVKKEWDRIKAEWSSCTRCSISNTATKVFGRGRIPAKILLVGEGPGSSEDALGYPFVGVAGRLLDLALEKLQVPRSDYFLTNFLCCRPVDSRGANRPPELYEAVNCLPRLRAMLDLVKPERAILLGRIPTRFWGNLLTSDYDEILTFSLPHPAWVCRQGGEKSEAFRSFTRELETAIKCPF